MTPMRYYAMVGPLTTMEKVMKLIETHYIIEQGFLNAHAKEDVDQRHWNEVATPYKDRETGLAGLKSRREAEEQKGETYMAGILQTSEYRLKKIETKTQVLTF